jgi:hypothetical protein
MQLISYFINKSRRRSFNVLLQVNGLTQLQLPEHLATTAHRSMQTVRGEGGHSVSKALIEELLIMSDTKAVIEVCFLNKHGI